jgi:hypothetical protein
MRAAPLFYWRLSRFKAVRWVISRPPWHERLRFTARWTWLEWRRRIVRARGDTS